MKIRKKAISLLLAAALIFPFAFVVRAEEPAENSVLSIRSRADFLVFCENCRLDSYSRSMTVLLECDLDLSETDFTGIPTFGGVFDGQGHTISGLSLTQKGSEIGLFRFLQEGGTVRNLSVRGSLSPSGMRSVLGGIAAVNGGTIENCTFSGAVSGSSTVGGIAGLNEPSGVISGCTTRGIVYGEHFVGGIVGENKGVVSRSTNSCRVNTTVEENEIDLKDITLGDLTETESAVTITDIGGISGTNSGVIRACVNFGTVGYAHIGYNIGGIAGSQTGYLEGCVNEGRIFGRKEVGGIVGQMEPDSTLIFSQSTLVRLSRELRTLKELVSKTSEDASTTVHAVNRRITRLQRQIDDAIEAADDLLDAMGKLKPSVSIDASTDLDDLLENLRPDIDTDFAEPFPELPSQGETEESEANPEGSLPEETDSSLPEEPLTPPSSSQEESSEPADTDEALSSNAAAFGTEISLLPLTAAAVENEPSEEDASDSEETEDLTLPTLHFEILNLDKLISARVELSDLLYEISKTVEDLSSTATEYSSLVFSDLEAVSDELNVIFDLIIDELDEQTNTQPGDRSEDISDADTEQDTTGKAANCRNTGTVQGDLNVGGIAGTMGIENDLDPEDDLSVEGNLSVNYRYTTRSVLRGCENFGSVTAKKYQAGGIVGSMDLGSVLECKNFGTLDAPGCDYVGGIAGKSSSVIRDCHVKCTLLGQNYVGGIAGSGSTITGCRVMLRIEESTALSGAIAGALEDGYPHDSETLSENFFVENGLGGIDGVSYEEKAYPLSYAEFSALDNLPEKMKHLTVTFLADEKQIAILEKEYGDSVSENEIPQIPQRNAFYAQWEPFEQEYLTFDTTVRAVYSPYHAVLESELLEGERPILLAEGSFREDDTLQMTKTQQYPPNAAGGCESWEVTIPQDGRSVHTLRCLSGESNSVLWLFKDGVWQRLEPSSDGSYLVFEASGDHFVLCRARQTTFAVLPAVISLAAAAALLLLCRHIRRSRKNRNSSSAHNVQKEENT